MLQSMGLQRVRHNEQLNSTALSIEHPGDSVVKNLPANAEDARGSGSIPGGQEDPLEEEMTTHSIIFAGEIP